MRQILYDRCFGTIINLSFHGYLCMDTFLLVLFTHFNDLKYNIFVLSIFFSFIFNKIDYLAFGINNYVPTTKYYSLHVHEGLGQY